MSSVDAACPHAPKHEPGFRSRAVAGTVTVFSFLLEEAQESAHVRVTLRDKQKYGGHTEATLVMRKDIGMCMHHARKA